MCGIAVYTFLNVCEKIHQSLSSIKKIHTIKNWFLCCAPRDVDSLSSWVVWSYVWCRIWRRRWRSSVLCSTAPTSSTSWQWESSSKDSRGRWAPRFSTKHRLIAASRTLTLLLPLPLLLHPPNDTFCQDSRGKPVLERWNQSGFKWGNRWWGLGCLLSCC